MVPKSTTSCTLLSSKASTVYLVNSHCQALVSSKHGIQRSNLRKKIPKRVKAKLALCCYSWWPWGETQERSLLCARRERHRETMEHAADKTTLKNAKGTAVSLNLSPLWMLSSSSRIPLQPSKKGYCSLENRTEQKPNVA